MRRFAQVAVGVALMLALLVPTACGGNDSSSNANPTSPTPANMVTLAQFNAIQEGMSYAQVAQVMGFQGTVSTRSDSGDVVGYSWNSGPGADALVIACVFVSDRLVSKAQSGLQ